MEKIWDQKYRPVKVQDCVLSSETRKALQSFVDSGDVPNLLFSGSPGIGKTTAAKAITTELNRDVMFINASLNGNIDTLRNEITQFASSGSLMNEGKKFVILDEADKLSQATQEGLRSFMDTYSMNCGFILTCNFPNKIIEPLHSRLSSVSFRVPQEEQKTFMVEALKRLVYILKEEGISFDGPSLKAVYERYSPDIRKTISTLQRYASQNGKIDSGIVSIVKDTSIDELLSIFKARDYKRMIEWVHSNGNLDFDSLVVKIWDESQRGSVEPKKLPYLVVHLNEYDYKDKFVVNKTLNIISMFTEIMRDCY